MNGNRISNIFVLMFLFCMVIVSGCNTTKAGITKIDITRNMLTGDVRVNGEFGKEYEDFTARVEKGDGSEYSVYIHFGKAKSLDVMREAMETQKRMIGMFEKFGEMGMGMLNPTSLIDVGPDVVEPDHETDARMGFAP